MDLHTLRPKPPWLQRMLFALRMLFTAWIVVYQRSLSYGLRSTILGSTDSVRPLHVFSHLHVTVVPSLVSLVLFVHCLLFLRLHVTVVPSLVLLSLFVHRWFHTACMLQLFSPWFFVPCNTIGIRPPLRCYGQCLAVVSQSFSCCYILGFTTVRLLRYSALWASCSLRFCSSDL